MAKVQKYVPQTKLPKNKFFYKLLDKAPAYDDFWHVYDLFTQGTDKDHYFHTYYEPYVKAFKDGSMDVANWRTTMGDWRHHHILNSIFPKTPEFKTINDAFMTEYDSRDDLQEIYKQSYGEVWAVYDMADKRIEKHAATALGYDRRPESFLMWNHVVGRSWNSIKQIELARETPYQEGDLVLLRKPYVNTKADPLYVERWSNDYRDGKRTPDDSILRIGTIIGITDRVANRTHGRGSKVIQLQWIGQEDVTDVAEKYIKWHERPTYKNGMKTR
jgi:hypothetical protein